jgi:hypothetical protein
MEAEEKVQGSPDQSLVDHFRTAYSALNPRFESNLIGSVTEVFRKLVVSLSNEQLKKAWSSLGRLLSSSQFSRRLACLTTLDP